jgi:hypothetical protein
MSILVPVSFLARIDIGKVPALSFKAPCFNP